MLKDLPREALLRPLTRTEVVSMLLRLTIFGAATYYSIKWIVEAMDPTAKQKSQAKKRAEHLMKRIGVEGVKLTEYEMNIASQLVDPQTMKVSWRDIAGLDEIINELQDTVILPFQKRHLLAGSKLFQPPKGPSASFRFHAFIRVSVYISGAAADMAVFTLIEHMKQPANADVEMAPQT